MTRFAVFHVGEPGERFAEIIGIDPHRVGRDACVEIRTDNVAVARIEVRLTKAELAQIVDLLDEHDPRPVHDEGADG